MKLRVRESDPVEAGIYSIKCISVEETETNFGACLKFKFLITSGEHAGRDIVALASIRDGAIGSSSKLYRWTSALLGTAPGEDFDTDDLLGRQALANITIVPGREANQRFNRIEAIMPATKSAKAKASQQTEADTSF